ncbi:Hypothetical predicted protein [Octopus vulgaris]|uniref:Uncharacterized protein n=1 Tax=Octopus vulgaris TaxID=6645 RepID=A0AA36FH59_OCTVU|nr:Hypothetical predicted protein [Octopus vulgaris]
MKKLFDGSDGEEADDVVPLSVFPAAPLFDEAQTESGPFPSANSNSHIRKNVRCGHCVLRPIVIVHEDNRMPFSTGYSGHLQKPLADKITSG